MKKYLIIGGTGSLGRKLIQRLLPTDVVAVYSRDEAKHWTIRNELSVGELAERLKNLQFFVGDIRDRRRIADVLRQYQPDVVIVAAALKQVDTCELSPSESVLTNLIGTQNVIDSVNEMMTPPHQVLFVSTDKACAPVNVYGMCKAISERIVTSQAGDTSRIPNGTFGVSYLAVRYGNVLESRGSIIPLFKYQAEHNEFLTVTDPEMTRFVMTLDDSVDLILYALQRGKSGETWIPRLPAMKIGHLAQIFADKHKKPIMIIGLRPGEKQHEDLINESESVRTMRILDPKGQTTHFVIAPAFVAGSNSRFVYSSKQDVMNRQELEAHLTKLGILDAPLEQFKGRTIEEIATNRKE